MVKIEFDDRKIVKALKDFGKSEKTINKSILTAIGNELKKREKQSVYDFMTKRSGAIKAKMAKSVKRDGTAVSVYSKATNPQNNVRYPFVLANKFGIDYLSKEKKAYENSSEMAKTIDENLKKQLKKANL